MVRTRQEANAKVAELIQRDDIRAARDMAAMRFRIAHGRDVPDEAHATFEGAIDEWVGNYLFKAVASDPYHPGFVHDFLAPHQSEGQQVPGARMGGDNPDNYYRLAGIKHGGRYKVTGRRIGTAPVNTSFTLAGNWGTSVHIDGVETEALEFDENGRFTITIDDTAGQGGARLTTQPHVKFLFVRDTMADWTNETPYELTIERLDDPGRGPLTDDEMAQEAAFRLVEDVPLYFWFHRIFSGKAPNDMDTPYKSGGIGGLVTQAGCHGRIDLGDDDCAIVRFDTAEAAYAAFELTDWWFRSIDANRIQSSITHEQAAPQPDGTYELVIARRDPGVANWLDTGGLANCLLLGRWQGLPSPDASPSASFELCKLSEIDPASGIAGGPMAIEARKAQYAERRASWCRRTGEDL